MRRSAAVGAANYDVIVIGAGPAGEVVAGQLAAGGYSVAIIERSLVGGECAFYACMPSKALLRPGELLAETRRVPGVVADGLDVAAVLARRDEVIHELDDSSQLAWLADRGVTLIRGHGRLDGERRVTVGERILDARLAVIIAVGSAAALPPIPGLAEAAPWTNREVTTAKAIPRELIILGGGVVGVEMAQAYSELGSQVTIIEALERLIAGEEPFASEQLATALTARGVELRLGVRAVAVERTEEGDVVVRCDDGSVVRGAQLLVAVGRRPLTSDLGLASVGLTEGESIEVDDNLRVPGAPWLFAIGDVNGRSLLTHMGKYQARAAAQVIAGGSVRATRERAGSPRVIFTDPQVAAVGLTLAAARERGIAARATDVATSATAGASFHGRNAPGTARLVIDQQRGVIVGATFTGPEVAEWLHAATLAVVGELTLAQMQDAVPAFPTRSEVWLGLLDAWAASAEGPA